MKYLVRLAVVCIVVTAPGPIHSQVLDLLTAPHTAPMEVLYGKPYVMVTVNGKGPFRFLIDTGTSGDAIITSELAAQLDLPSAGEGKLLDPTGQGGDGFPKRKLDTMRVAGVDFYSIRAIEHALPVRDFDCQGMLGFRFFRDFLLTLDYVHGQLILAEGELIPDGEKSVLPFTMPEGVPIARLKIADHDVDAQIDSGGAGLSVPEPLVPKLRLAADPEVFAYGQTLFARFQVKVAKLANDVQLGDITFNQPWVEINPAFSMANFGSAALDHFTVTFDQENKLVRFEGPRKRITLGVTPTPLRLTNQPANPSEVALVPVG